jgi:hypothetical protein
VPLTYGDRTLAGSNRMLGMASSQLGKGNLHRARAARYGASAMLGATRVAGAVADRPGVAMGIAGGGIGAAGYMSHRRNR